MVTYLGNVPSINFDDFKTKFILLGYGCPKIGCEEPVEVTDCDDPATAGDCDPDVWQCDRIYSEVTTYTQDQIITAAFGDCMKQLTTEVCWSEVQYFCAYKAFEDTSIEHGDHLAIDSGFNGGWSDFDAAIDVAFNNNSGVGATTPEEMQLQYLEAHGSLQRLNRDRKNPNAKDEARKALATLKDRDMAKVDGLQATNPIDHNIDNTNNTSVNFDQGLD